MLEEIATYFHQLFGARLALAPYDGMNAVPYLLRSSYTFFVAKINGLNFLLMCNQKKTKPTPGAVKKHAAIVQKHLDIPVVYVAESMPSYQRIRLLRQQMPFIVPGRQLYLPFLGMAFSEADKKADKEFSTLGTLAQLILLGHLNGLIREPLTLAAASKLFSYSRVSVIRAFDELEYFFLAQRESGTRRLVFPMPAKTLWEQALPVLNNPCRRSVGLEALPGNLPVHLAGTSALSEQTLLAESAQKEFATSVNTFNAVKKTATISKIGAPIVLQLWTYPPGLLARETVDPFSLYLTLKDDADERVQIALDELMERLLDTR